MSKVYIISAPSGAGKTSLVKGACESIPFVKPSISYTTRNVRDSEIACSCCSCSYVLVEEDAGVE